MTALPVYTRELKEHYLQDEIVNKLGKNYLFSEQLLKRHMNSSSTSVRSGVTKVGVTGAATDGVTYSFLEKLTTFFSHRPLQSDDGFSCRLLATPIFPRQFIQCSF